ncbi:MAG TPA: carbamate kinase [Actinomycetes bacterium]|jgi:carbamate kinase|nr:carbamate kinase [Actinomycetes bacterium]
MSTVVIAVGGNAVLAEGEQGTYEQQLAHMASLAKVLSYLVRDGHRVVLTHGNGPQVGNLAIQQEEGARLVPPQPLFVLGAMTQGQMGHLITAALCGDRAARERPVATIVTHALVDLSDPAFHRPTKPIGPFYLRREAERLARERHWQVIEDAGRGWRRVVPSPEPQGFLEADAIRALVEAGFVVVASGGGGIPVAREGARIRGVDAVIDKDLSAQRLASAVGADTLVLLTGVDYVWLGFGTARQRAVGSMTVDEAEKHLADGEFPPGSMGPKVTAAIRFVRSGGDRAIITSPRRVREALAGRDGTSIIPGRVPAGAERPR